MARNKRKNYNSSSYRQGRSPIGNMISEASRKLSPTTGLLFMSTYDSITTPGKRRYLPIMLVLGAGYGTVKVAGAGVKAIGRGAKKMGDKIKQKQEQEEQEEKEREYNGQTEEERENKKYEDYKNVTEEPINTFTNSIEERLEDMAGNTLKVEKKKEKGKEQLYLGLGGKEKIKVDETGLYDSKGESLFKEDLVSTIQHILNKYDNRHENSLLAIIDQYLLVGKIHFN